MRYGAAHAPGSRWSEVDELAGRPYARRGDPADICGSDVPPTQLAAQDRSQREVTQAASIHWLHDPRRRTANMQGFASTATTTTTQDDRQQSPIELLN